MSTHACCANAAVPAAVRTLFRVAPPTFAVLFAVLLSGCSGAGRSLVAGPDPSDPAVPVPAATYRSSTVSYASQRPVAPAPWGRTNERTAPQSKTEN